ncbi:hypothetical protein L249_5748 [Ophiocordyceps polyrhachis-furcata BCC 54312]|uniref:Uncharacterized protein n=1 Tax=Ophiocordyceps polyrhachis-furcata BCC 54312 TaxID=1330021 RepID=A0A367L019_9HYPO|nr:hypothetical protein L249_5748 [Ophiocordyceps polyrhachis-furcata BCC 54312]
MSQLRTTFIAKYSPNTLFTTTATKSSLVTSFKLVSVLVLTKQINPRIVSSVLYEDIANTIDGGDGASADSLLACGSNGGQLGVKVNKKNSAYKTADFREKRLRNSGIIVKLVKNPDADDDE